MAFNGLLELHEEPSIDTDRLSHEIFSILEKKFLFGHDSSKLWIPKQVPLSAATEPGPKDSLPCNQTEESSPSTVSEGDARRRIRILSIDGGGCSSVRGVLPCRALAHLEHAIREKSNDQNAIVADYFDVVAGTGIGGIVAAMLVATEDGHRAAFRAEDTWRLLIEQGKWTSNSSGGGFLRRLLRGGGGRVGSGGKAFEKFLRETFSGRRGRALTLRDTLKPVLIPCYDLSTAAPFLFSRADALESDGYDFRLWEVCRATSAEPSLLEPVPMQSVNGKSRCVGFDGGLAMSNPTAAAITHVLHNKKEFPHVRGMEDILVLSLGTGQVNKVGGGGGGGEVQYENVKGWKVKDWAKPAVRIIGDGSADLVDQAVAMAFSRCGTGSYVRIQANGSNLNIEKTSSPSSAEKLAEIAEQMLKQKNVESVLFGGRKISDSTNFEKLDSFAADLVLEHNGRKSCRASSAALNSG